MPRETCLNTFVMLFMLAHENFNSVLRTCLLLTAKNAVESGEDGAVEYTIW